MPLSLHIRVEGETPASSIAVEIEGRECVADLASKAACACNLKQNMFVLLHEEAVLNDCGERINEHSFKDGDEVVVRVDESEKAKAKLREIGLHPTWRGLETYLDLRFDTDSEEESLLEVDMPLRDVVRLFVMGDPSILHKYVDGETMLHVSIWGDPEVVSLLIENGAEVDSPMEGSNETILHLALHEQKFDILQIALSHGASVASVDANGCTPLHCVHHLEEAKLLVEYGADVSVKDFKGNTPLHRQHFSSDIYKFLVSCGANEDVLNYEGRKPSTSDEYSIHPLHA
eukprot:TRINITY_DN5381_c1_g1_i1.p1 TRINITY_DN5381_c1_g1~~TRINITY_DN5381_c1_g1_i1.p1  ORF type:complete len:288 (+),score=28.57 TRINITY_DN5381_c1_g1_i1:67-930(+)